MESVVTTAIAVLGVFAVLRLVRAFTLRPAGGDAFSPVPDLSALDGLLASSDRGPVVLFLHDPYCPISGGAYRKLVNLDADVHLIDVSRQHDLWRAIERATGVRHESPQVIVVSGRTAVYDASHGRINASDVEHALSGGPIDAHG